MLSSKVDRRTLLRGLTAAGATAAFVSACAPQLPTLPGQSSGTATGPVTTTTGLGTMASGVPYGGAKGPGGNLAWKPGDSMPWLPQEKIPAGKAADAMAQLPKQKLLTTYERMVAARKWETKMKDLFVDGKDGLYGAFHVYIGEEGVANGTVAALNDDDWIVSTHRGHGHLIAKGGSLDKMSAEIFFRETGANKGYGGSMHIVEVDKGILGMNGIVGASYYLAAGAARGALVKGTKQVAVAFGGDGSTNSPYYFSAVRSAANYKLPVIFMIENNFFMIPVPMATVTPTPWVSHYTAGLGIPSITIDGNDVTAVYSATREAVERARSGGGPSVIEAVTYRWYDHAGFAGAKVGIDGAFGIPTRTDDEVRAWMARDPIKRYGAWLVERNLSTQAELTGIDNSVQARVDASVEFARSSPKPAPSAGVKNVYANADVAATQFYAAVPVSGLA
jgi:pyruvate dehydrogenase E1 component alpha subunit